MKKTLSAILTLLVCAIFSCFILLTPQRAQIISSGPGAGSAVEPQGGLLYFVNTTSDTVVANACANGNAGCSLRGAIQAANSHAGLDGIEIDLPSGSVINLTQVLPDVTDNVAITGAGPSSITVRRNTVAHYRIFNVTATGPVTFSGLTISNGSSSVGGGIQKSNSGTVTIINCAFSGNMAGTAGGIFNNGGTVNVTNSTFTENAGTDGGYFGGGSGGGIYNNAGTVNVTGSAFVGNSGLDGGGIFNKAGATVSVVNSTFSGNSAIATGGGLCNDGAMSVTSSTITGNIAGTASVAGLAGGLISRIGTVNLKSNIIALNTASSNPDVSGVFSSFGFNLIGKNDGSSGITATTDQRGTVSSPLDPKLDPAGQQNNGGPTRSIALLANSPAIDKGTSSSLSTDQRGVGFARTVDNPGVANAAGSDGTDIGAYERKLRAVFDFDGDGKTDVGIFRPQVGEWWYLRSSDGHVPAFQFGSSTDKIVPADFTGDGKTDIAFYRPSTGEWFVLRSEDLSYFSFPFGAAEDIPVPADYDNDGKADPAVFRPSTGLWVIQRSSDNGTTFVSFGSNGDVPVAADYDGDGRADIAIFRPSVGQWWLLRSTAGVIAFGFGSSTDRTVQGDYTGDGKSDVAFWRPASGEWFVLRSENLSYYSVPFGLASDVPAPGDYDGDGKFDTTVFRAASGSWFIQRSTAGTLAVPFGANGDRPIPNAYIP